MKKYKLLPIIISMILLSSCGLSNTTHFTFQQDVDQIREITIIDITDKADIENASVIKTVETNDVDKLINDIKGIEMKKPVITGETFPPFGVSIKILYKNGEYDVIAANEAGYYKYNDETGKIVGYTAGLIYSKEDFEAVINKYTTE